MDKAKEEEITNRDIKETKGLTGEALQRKSLEWAFAVWEDYQAKDIPVKPQVVIDHEEIPKEDRKKLKKEYFEDHPEIFEYYNKVHRIIIENESKMEWLDKMKGYCQTDEELAKVKGKIAEYRKMLAIQWPEKYATKETKEAVNNLAEMVKGSVEYN